MLFTKHDFKLRIKMTDQTPEQIAKGHIAKQLYDYGKRISYTNQTFLIKMARMFYSSDVV